jgi:hypothetical protein
VPNQKPEQKKYGKRNTANERESSGQTPSLILHRHKHLLKSRPWL